MVENCVIQETQRITLKTDTHLFIIIYFMLFEITQQKVINYLDFKFTNTIFHPVAQIKSILFRKNQITKHTSDICLLAFSAWTMGGFWWHGTFLYPVQASFISLPLALYCFCKHIIYLICKLQFIESSSKVKLTSLMSLAFIFESSISGISTGNV